MKYYKEYYIILLLSFILLSLILYKPQIESLKNMNNIYCFWTGNNKMSESRSKALESLNSVSGCNIILITSTNLQDYIINKHPLHPSYEYLSETHKSDYLRTYFMHFYGGGYSDIKVCGGDWNSAFNDIIYNDNIILNGYHESSPDHVAGDEYTKSYWREIPANSAYIIRPNTIFTYTWYNTLLNVLDTKLDTLKKYPSTHPQSTPDTSPGYPIKWTEILGDIYHPLTCKYRNNILFTLPPPVLSKSYR
jgi:hypothetical protein